MSLRAVCDAAQVVRGEIEDRRDLLRLLAVIARGVGAKGLEDYEPPSAAWEDWLDEQKEA